MKNPFYSIGFFSFFFFLTSYSISFGQKINFSFTNPGTNPTVTAIITSGNIACILSADVYIFVPQGITLSSIITSPDIAGGNFSLSFETTIQDLDLYVASFNAPNTEVTVNDNSFDLFSFSINGCATGSAPNPVVRFINPDFPFDFNNPDFLAAVEGFSHAISVSPNCSNTQGAFEGLGVSSVSVCSDALPVELTKFTARANNDQTSLLTWATATEINNDYFDIEHSADGIEFRSIGKIKGAGTTEQPQNYEFIHRRPVVGTNYYRLRQVDFDGAFEYSDIETVNFEDGRPDTAAFRIFPNPTDDHLMILPPDTGKAPWNIDVFDVQGKLMTSFIMNSSHRLDTAGWPAGVYHIRIGNDDQNESLRFVKQ